jgi:hypothetical protein
MKKLFVAAIAALTVLASAAVAAAALAPGVYDPGSLGCVKATFAKKTLHLEKTCARRPMRRGVRRSRASTARPSSRPRSRSRARRSARAARRASTSIAGGVLYYLGCNNVTPTQNADGTATYLFTAATLAAAGQQVPTPTGTISYVEVLLDVQGAADLTKISFNGIAQKVVTGNGKGLTAPCKNGGWKTFTSPKFKNQGQCVSALVHSRNAAKKAARG